VRVEHPRGAPRAARRSDPDVEQTADRLGVDRPGPQQLRRIGRQVDDRALDADPAGATVEDAIACRIEQVSEVVEHVLSGGRADLPEQVRGRCGHAAVEPFEHGEGQGVGRNPDADGVPTAGDPVARARTTPEQHRERSGPARGGQGRGGAGDVVDPPVERVGGGDVHDERVVARAPLRPVDPGDCVGTVSDRRQAVHRLGRDRDEPTGEQGCDGLVDVGRDQLTLGSHRGTRAWRR
jgi:hypothetical protein